MKLDSAEKFAILYMLVLIGGIILCGYQLGILWDIITFVLAFGGGMAIGGSPFFLILWLMDRKDKKKNIRPSGRRYIANYSPAAQYPKCFNLVKSTDDLEEKSNF